MSPAEPVTNATLIEIDAASFYFLDFQKSVQMAEAGGMPHFAERLGFDLTDALASHPELAAHFLQGAGKTVTQAEAQFQHFALALAPAGEHIGELGAQQTEAGHFGGGFRGL